MNIRAKLKAETHPGPSLTLTSIITTILSSFSLSKRPVQPSSHVLHSAGQYGLLYVTIQRCLLPAMQRNLTVLWKTVALLLVASSLLIGFNWDYTNAKPYIPKWFQSSDWKSANETVSETVSSPLEDAPPSAPPSPPSIPALKDGNTTLLEMAPSYIKAIMTPEDTSFPRLACSAPTSDRYDYLKTSSTNMTHGPSSPKYFFALDLHQCASLLPRLIGSVIDSIRFLGPQNCALSVVEGRSDDGTFEILLSLRKEVERIGAKYYFNSSDTNPTVGDRIEGLAKLRNQALQPLLDHADKATPNSTTVIF